MLVLLGCNHRSAPVAFRERLAFDGDRISAALDKLRRSDRVDEAVILSTCNRVELVVRGEGATEPGVAFVKEFLRAESGVDSAQFDRHVYVYTGLDAVRHLFRVAAGLDSMILGEPQILGQVKQGYLTAKSEGATGTILDHLFQQCLKAAKKIRTDTGISRNAVSVAYAAVHLARRIFGELTGRRVLLVGSGKMMQLVAKHLVANGVSDVEVTSRTFNHAVTLAELYSGRALHWEDGLQRISEVDIVVSCTGAPHTILGRAEVARARRRRRGQPLFIIDIAVPRDIEPDVNGLDNVYLYDIDGLQSVVDANLAERRRAAAEAEERIETEVEGFDRWRQSLEITPTIVSLRERILSMAEGEVERFRRRLGPLSAEQQRAVEEMCRALVQKMLHRPVVHLRKSVERGDVDASTSMYRKIFGLDDGPKHSAPHEGEAFRGRPDEPDGPRRLLRGGKDD